MLLSYSAFVRDYRLHEVPGYWKSFAKQDNSIQNKSNAVSHNTLIYSVCKSITFL